jgi:separase
MHAVNEASQKLSTAVQAGWKVSSGGPRGKTMLSAADSVATHLEELRDMCPGDVDVERAASSVIGKLIAVEMVCHLYVRVRA